MDRARVVVIGAGFGGLQAAKELADAPVRVTVVDRNNFHTFLPLLYQVATAGLNPADVAHAVRGIFHRRTNVDFRQATVTGVDWDRRQLHLDGQDPLAFDHLVVAAGSSPNFYGIPGAAEHAFPLYALDDAVALRNHLLERFEDADREPGLVAAGALTFVIVGGGPTGVETAGAMAELIDKVLRRDFRHLDVDLARVVLVEAADTLLPPFSDRSRRHALAELRRRGVEVRLDTTVEAVHADHVVLSDGEELSTSTLIWAAGVQANPLAAVLGIEVGPGGRIPVGPDLAIAGRTDAWAVGDIAHIAGHRGDLAGRALPQLAPVAIQSGAHAARNILAVERGGTTTAFTYRDKGTMATIGRRSAVAELPQGPVLTGSLAWGAWLALHLYYLIGFRNRVSVLVNWAWNYLTWDRGPRLILRSEPRRSGADQAAA